MKKKSWKIIVAMILLLISIWAGYWCSVREGFYEDEVWTFLLADSYYNPSLSDDSEYLNHWLKGEYFKDAITVQEGERFDLGSVNYNQTKDSHPPLYYDVINVLGSIVPDTFCVNLAYGANLVFLVITAFFCGLIALQITEDYRIAIFVISLYGFSTMAVGAAMYLRMYMLLTMFVVISTYLHLKLLRQESDWHNWLFLLCIVGIAEWFGGMTQYFFWLFQLLLSIGLFFLLLLDKKYRKAQSYVVMEIFCGIVYILGWPYIFDHMSSGSNSPQKNLDLISEGMEKLKTLGRYINFLFGGAIGLLPLIILAFIIFIVCGTKLKWFKKESCMKIAAPELILIMTALIYILIVIQIVPSFAVNWPKSTIAVRYFWPVYPLVIIFIGTIIGCLIIKLAPRKCRLIFCGVLAAFFVNQYLPDNTVKTLLYQGTAETMNEIESEQTRAIQLTTGDYKYVILLNMLSTHSEVINVHIEDFQAVLESCMKDGKLTEDLILYVEWGNGYKESAEQILNEKGLLYENINPSGSLRFYNVFKLYAQ